MLFCCTKLSVKLLSELRYQDMISVQCNVNTLLPNVAFSKAILSHENCMSHSMSILSGKYTYPFFSTHLSKTIFSIASLIPWTDFIPIGWLSALNSCTRFSNRLACCKAWPKATKVSMIRKYHNHTLQAKQRHCEEDRDNITLKVTLHH